MSILVSCRLCFALGIVALTIPALSIAAERQVDVVQTSQGPLRITPIFHASVMLEFAGKVIYVDPGRGEYTDLPPGDVILVTHTHDDHLDKMRIEKQQKPSAVVVGTPSVLDTINCRGCTPIVLSDTEKKTIAGVEMEGVPMYNLPRAGREPRHHRGVGEGFILNFGDARVYFSGDTDCTAEVKGLKNITVAFVLGMNNAADTAQCVKEFKPKIFYPYHDRGLKQQDVADALKSAPEIELRFRKMETTEQ